MSQRLQNVLDLGVGVEAGDFSWDCLLQHALLLILKEKVARFNADPEIQDILKTLAHLSSASVNGLGSSFKYSEKTAAALKNHKFDLAPLRTQGFRYERLDQLTTEVLLGTR